MRGIADTGFLVAFANGRDEHHPWALEVARSLSEPALTCEAVLAETAFHLRNAQLVLEMIDEELIRLAFRSDENHAQLRALARRYEDRTPDFADLCLIRMSELHPDHAVITADSEFRVYRRNKREVIPALYPQRHNRRAG